MRDDIREVLERAAQSGVASTLGRIEIAVWLILGLLVIFAIAAYVRFENRRSEKARQQSGWANSVERAYDRGDYKSALQTLETSQEKLPGSALVLYWQARCHFRLEEWDKAAAKFEECLRLEPIYRQYVKDYMAHIEKNGLVAGVEGYLKE